MQAASSQLHLTTGVSTCKFGTSSPTAAKETSARVPRLAQYVAVWLDGIEGLVQPSTVEAYAGRLHRHVLPRLADRRLDEIEVDDILGLIRDLRKAGYSGTTIAVTLTPLSRLFAHAVRRGLIEVNPVSKLDRSEGRASRGKTGPSSTRRKSGAYSKQRHPLPNSCCHSNP